MKVFNLFKLLILLGITGELSAEQINFYIEPLKEQFLVGEPIWIKMTVRNTGNEPVNITDVGYGGPRDFDITDTKGRKYGPFIAVSGDFIKPPLIILNPKDPIVKYSNLFGQYLYGVASRYFYPAEKYTIRAKIRSHKDEKDWTGEAIRSNVATFTIVEPKGEETQVWQELLSTLDQPITKENQATKYSQVSELIKRYSQSVYTPESEWSILHYKAFKESEIKELKTDEKSFPALIQKETINEQFKNYVFKYPNYPRAEDALTRFLGYYRSVAPDSLRVQTILDSLITTYPETFIGKHAKHVLNKLKEKK